MLATWNSLAPWEKDPLKPPQKTAESLPHHLAGNKQECDNPQTKRPMTPTQPMREFNNKLEVAEQELALRREAASFNHGAAANRRPAGQSVGSDDLSATLAADRALPAAVAGR